MYSVHISDQFLRYACSSECEDEQQSRFPLSHCSIANCEHFRSREIFLMTVRNICEHDFLSELSEKVLDSIVNQLMRVCLLLIFERESHKTRTWITHKQYHLCLPFRPYRSYRGKQAFSYSFFVHPKKEKTPKQ